MLFFIVETDTTTVVEMTHILHLNECMDMTVNQVIEKNNLLQSVTNNDGTEQIGGIVSHISYLSEMFGQITFANLTKQFISQYSNLLNQQLKFNRHMILSKSKLITDFISCHLLLYSENNNISHITNLIQTIRK
jgi:hypothetical protein